MDTEFNPKENLSNYHGIPLVLRARFLSKANKISPTDAAQASLRAAKDAGLHE